MPHRIKSSTNYHPITDADRIYRDVLAYCLARDTLVLAGQTSSEEWLAMQQAPHLREWC